MLNRAESPGGNCLHACPYGSFTIFNERVNSLSRNLRVLSQLAVLPTGQPFMRANPKSSIARDEKASNKAAGQMLIPSRLPRNGSNAIEAKQAEIRAQPEITVGGLRNCVDSAFGKAVANLPRRVRILTDVERWVQRGNTRAAGQENASVITALPCLKDLST